MIYRWNELRVVLGFVLKGIGFFWTIFDRYLCGKLCERGMCVANETATCYLLILFVGIIFIVCGYALITMHWQRKKKIKKIGNRFGNMIKNKIKHVVRLLGINIKS